MSKHDNKVFSEVWSLKPRYNKLLCGFTLSELLLSLMIVGVLAVLTVPVLLSNVQKQVFAVQIKNFSAGIEQLAKDELLSHRTKDLSNTDFADPAKLLSDRHFEIVKSCSADTALQNCWKTALTGKDKIVYKRINGKDTSFSAGYTIILKNGVLVRYISTPSLERAVGSVVVDLNGNEKPNVSGRDVFGFYISPKGNVVTRTYAQNLNMSDSEILSACKTGDSDVSYFCFEALVKDNWKMNY